MDSKKMDTEKMDTEKMNLEEFTDTVVENLRRRAGDGWLVEKHMREKNNGVFRTGIMAGKEDSRTMAVMETGPYFRQYLSGNMDMESVVEETGQILGMADPVREPVENRLPGVSDPVRESVENHLYSYGKMREKVIFRLVNREKNRELLEQVPWVPFLDMAVQFRLLVGKDEYRRTELLVNREVYGSWQVGLEELMEQAERNMRRLCPPVLRTVDGVLREAAGTGLLSGEESEGALEILDKEKKIPLYVLSNGQGINGAAAVLHRDVLRGFADSMETDIVILFSSIHEVLLVPREEDTDFDMLRYMVMAVNRSEVPPEEQLSDHVYLYRRETGEIEQV